MDEIRFARIVRVLADPRRLALMERIAAESEVGCRALLKGCPVSQATVSHHVHELAEAGLVAVRREGKFAYIRAIPEEVDAYLAELRRRLSPSPSRPGHPWRPEPAFDPQAERRRDGPPAAPGRQPEG